MPKINKGGAEEKDKRGWLYLLLFVRQKPAAMQRKEETDRGAPH